MTDRNLVEVTERHSRFVDAQVERGLHRNAGEVVSEALRRYEAGLAGDDDRTAVLRPIAADGRAGVERGELATVDGEEGSRALLARLNARAPPSWRGSRSTPGALARYRLALVAEAEISRISAQSEREFGVIARERYATLVVTAVEELAADPNRLGVRGEPLVDRQPRTYHLPRSRGRVPTPPGQDAEPRHALVLEVGDDGTVVILGVIHERTERGAAPLRYGEARGR